MPKIGNAIIFQPQHGTKLLKGVITDKYKESVLDTFGKCRKRMLYEVKVALIGSDFPEEFQVCRNSLNNGYIEVGYDRYFGGYVGYDI